MDNGSPDTYHFHHLVLNSRLLINKDVNRNRVNTTTPPPKLQATKAKGNWTR